MCLQNAARLLVRISANLEAFPAHAAAILTSTVVECHRYVPFIRPGSHLRMCKQLRARALETASGSSAVRRPFNSTRPKEPLHMACRISSGLLPAGLAWQGLHTRTQRA